MLRLLSLRSSSEDSPVSSRSATILQPCSASSAPPRDTSSEHLAEARRTRNRNPDKAHPLPQSRHALLCTLVSLFSLLFLFSSSSDAQTTAITNITVIDPASGAAQAARTITIEGQTIKAISDTAAAKLDANTTRIDGSGLFAIPGLIDSHVHFVDPDSYGPLMIAHGVTFVRDMGGATETTLQLRENLNSGKVLGPRMIATGAIVDGDPPVWPFSEACKTPEDARAAVQKLHKAGVNQIKVYSRLTPDAHRAACEEAKKLGLMPVGHCPESITIWQAIEHGQRTNEHMQRLSALIAEAAPPAPEPERRGVWPGLNNWTRFPDADMAKLRPNLKKLADSGMIQCPTVVVMQGIASVKSQKENPDERTKYVSAPMRAFWDQPQYAGMSSFIQSIVPHMKSMVGELHRAGATLIAGTDLANPFVFAGSSLHDELLNFQEAGLSPAEALRTATTTPARAFNLDAGEIAPGKLASLVLCEANPLDDIKNARKIKHVLLAGRHFDRAALDGLLKESLAAASPPAPADAPKVSLDVPGNVIARGTYAIKFGEFNAGEEDFVISKSDDGFHIAAHSKPAGGPQPPTHFVGHFNLDFTLKSATLKTFAKAPVESHYVIEGKSFKATATTDGKPEPEQVYPIPETWVLALPINASDFVMVRQHPLKPGEKFEGRAVSFGLQSWRVDDSPSVMQRHEDTTLSRAGKDVPARRYTATTTTPMGKFESESWLDTRGVPLKSTLKMPFGKLTMELKE